MRKCKATSQMFLGRLNSARAIYVYAGDLFGRLDVFPSAEGKYHGWLLMTDGTALGSWAYDDLRFGYYDLDGRARQLARPLTDEASREVDQMAGRAYPAVLAGHSHPEAFNLMTYRTDDGLLQEWLWNSRDGVTPFVIMTADGLREMKHVDWQRDQFLPDFKPKPGQRIFATRTRERAEQLATEFVESNWDHPEYPMSASFASKEEAAAAMLSSYWGDGHAPCVVTVQADGTWEGQQPPAGQEGAAASE